jgi:predicted nucleic acid-binding protein
MIAAVAAVNDMVVVTRNVRHFEPFGVTTLNPFGRPTA